MLGRRARALSAAARCGPELIGGGADASARAAGCPETLVVSVAPAFVQGVTYPAAPNTTSAAEPSQPPFARRFAGVWRA